MWSSFVIVRPRCVRSKRKQSLSLMSLHSCLQWLNAPAPASYAYSESGESFQYTFTYCEAKRYRLYAKRDLIVFVIECEYHLFLSLPVHVC